VGGGGCLEAIGFGLGSRRGAATAARLARAGPATPLTSAATCCVARLSVEEEAEDAARAGGATPADSPVTTARDTTMISVR
jgi:hypothetical protein